jgi:hypothetical protein
MIQYQGVITNCGALAPASRLAKLIAVELVVVKAMLNVPFPLISDVTLMLYQVPDVLIGPDEPVIAVS